MTPNVGANMKLYYNSGTNASPTWVDIDEVGDVRTNGIEWSSGVLARRSNTYKKEIPARIEPITITFTLIHGLDATVFDVLRAASMAGTVYQFAIMNGSIETSGNEGFTVPGWLKRFPWDQPLEDISGHECEMVGGYLEESSTEIDPAWKEVGSSSSS